MVKRSRIVAFFLLLILFASVIGATTNQITKNIKLGLDLQGGFEVLYEVKPAKKGDVIDKQALVNTVNALNKRVNVLGVSEPNIQIEGDNRIRVQLAGVKDQNKAREILSTEANLTFRDVNDKKLLDGTDLAQNGAKQSFDENGKPNVALKLKDAEKFAEVTQHILNMAPNNLMVIWLDFNEGKDSYKAESVKPDPKFISAATVNQVFNQTDVTITGNFTVQEAKELAAMLNAGALPVKLKEVYSTSVGAKFGESALKTTVFAGIVGVVIIFLFMLFFYRLPGVVAVITLSIYIYLVLLIFDWMNAVLTLPGIAAIILGVGMAVDANIITYERIKDELKLGKSIMSAYRAGNRNSLTAIFDANLTTILAAAVLFFYGTSSIKGFATMLIISVLMSFLTAVYGTRLFLGLLINSRYFNKKISFFGVKKSEIIPIEKVVDDTEIPNKFQNIDFVKHHNKFFALSGILIGIGMILLFVFKLNLGIDFTSGTRIEVMADKALTTTEVQEELQKMDIEADDIVLSGDNHEIGVARLKGVLSKSEIKEVKDHFKDLYGSEPNISTVSPTVGKELVRNGMISLLIASVGIVIYVTIRFEMYMALAAIVSLLHDAFFMVAFFSITRLEVDLTFIAAVLTIVGYSINDTIVTFDRIREIAKKRKIKTIEDIKTVANLGIQQTLTRSINTVLTVLVTVIALLIFGSESIRNFSIALFVGLIAGVYSSIFIASQLWVVWKGRQLNKKRLDKKAAKPESNI